MKRRILAVVLSAALLGSEFSFIPEAISLRPSYAVAQTPSEAEKHEQTAAPKQEETVAPAKTPEPAALPTKEPAQQSGSSTATSEPSAAPEATATSEPSAAPEATATSEPSAAPEATATSEPSVAPEAPATSEPSVAPEATATSEPSATPEATATSEPTATPEQPKEEHKLFTEGYACVQEKTKVYAKRSLADGSVMGCFDEDGYVYADERYGEGADKDWMKIYFAAEIGNQVSIEEGYLYALDLEPLSLEEENALFEEMIEDDDTEMTDEGVLLKPIAFIRIKAKPTAKPTIEPTVEPTAEPTAELTIEPVVEPTVEPTSEPTAEPATAPVTQTPNEAEQTNDSAHESQQMQANAVQTPSEAMPTPTGVSEAVPEQTTGEAAPEQTAGEATPEQTAGEAMPEQTAGEATPSEATPDEAMHGEYYVCGMIEHTHDASCMDENGVLICGLEEHTHDETCVVDYETAADWEATFADIELTDDLRANVVAIARSQLGYTESELNYVMDGDAKHGYTRYGQWHGTPYADWCAIFAAFCLHYGGVEGIPSRASTGEWQKEFERLGLYADAAEYTPRPGDVVFIDTDADGRADHAAIVEELDENAVPAQEATPDEAADAEAAQEDTAAGVLRVITGNVNRCVQRVEYVPESEKLVGYGVLPTPHTYVYADESLYVEVTLPAGSSVPEDAVLLVTPITEESDEYAAYVAQADAAMEGIADIALFDISFYTAEGDYYPVGENASVTMGFIESPIATPGEAQAATEIRLLHFEDENGTPRAIRDFSFGERELDMLRTDVESARQASAAPFAMRRSAAAETQAFLSPADGTAAGETTSEKRTVIEFTTPGFSLFAVVAVEKKDGYTTRILTAEQALNVANNDHPLDGKIIAISGRERLNNEYQGLKTQATENNEGKKHMGAAAVGNDGTNVIVGEDMLWKFEKVEEQKDTYYIRPYDVKNQNASGYLKVFRGEDQLDVLEEPQPELCEIQVTTSEYGRTTLYNGQRYVAFDKESGNYVSYQKPNESRGDLVLSEYVGETPVTNLDRQTLAIVGVKDLNNPIAITSNPGANQNRLQHIAATWKSANRHAIDTQGENVYWTFTAVNAELGQYYVQSANGNYLTIGDSTAKLDKTPHIIVVTAQTIENTEYVFIGEVAGNITYSLNQFGGNLNGGNYQGFAGWEGKDEGSRFVLARETPYTANVVSRANLRAAAMMPNAQIIIFVRQKVDGVDRYYAVRADGSAEEIYLNGNTLEEGAVMSFASDDKAIRWDATGSATGVGWGSAQYDTDTLINLQYKNVGTGEYLLPNVVGGKDNIVSPNDPQENRPLYWGERPSPVISVTAPADVVIDTSIANMVLANPERKLDGADATQRLTYVQASGIFSVEDVSNVNGPKEAAANETNVFYVAVIDTTNLEEEKTTDRSNLVGQILSPEEFVDAGNEYGDSGYPFMLIAEKDGKVYALDANGDAQPVRFIKDNTLSAGGRFVFEKEKAVGENYNPNRILWSFAAGEADGNNSKMWLTNEATRQYLEPGAAGVTITNPYVAGATQPSFNVVNNGIGVTVQANGYGLTWDGDNGFGSAQNNFTTFYVAMLVDWDVTVEGAEEEKPSIEEYQKVKAVEENVKMWVFNYGADIDYYGQRYNQTVYANPMIKDNNGNVTGEGVGPNLIYRFFHRPSFRGQAIDGTNEETNEYATSDAFQGKGPLQIKNTLGEDGVPHINTTNTGATTQNDTDFSLKYLFDTGTDFVASSEALELSQTGGGDWQVITQADGTAINSDNKTTPIANEYDPIHNPNYAFKRYPVANDGEGTGLFQIDPDTGNYYYDSALNAAWYNAESQKMELYDYALVPGGSLACIGGNFIPFNLGHTGARRVETNEGWRTNKAHVQFGINERTYQLNGFRHTDSPTIGRPGMTDLWMGMYMEIEFTMTAEGMVVPKNAYGEAQEEQAREMVFEFQGDDDVLVYIDDVLVLDISGIHGAEYGDINFHTGLVRQGDSLAGAKQQSTLKERFTAANKGDQIVGERLKPWTTHTLKFFYLERGGNISNCRISYNLDFIPTGDLSIKKEVVGVEESDDYAGKYNFKLDISELGAMSGFTGKTYPISYQIRDAQGKIVKVKQNDQWVDTYVIFEDATHTGEQEIINRIEALTITLEANQTAYFTGLPENTKLTIKELAPENGWGIETAGFELAEGGTDMGGEQQAPVWTSKEITIQSAKPEESQIVCQNTLKTVSLNIAKALEGVEEGKLTDKKFTVKYKIVKPNGEVFKVDGVEYDNNGYTVTAITPGDKNKHTITNIPFGSRLDIEEITTEGYEVSWRFTTKVQNDTDEVKTETYSPALDTTENEGDIYSSTHVNEIPLFGDVEFTFINKPTQVIIEKTVEGEDTSKAFTFTVSAVDANNRTVDLADGDKRFTLTSGQRHIIYGLPHGAKVTVTETNADGYSTRYDAYSRYEAEDAVLSGSAEKKKAQSGLANASNGSAVGGIGEGANNNVTFTINAPEQNNATPIRVYYNTKNDRTFIINDKALTCAANGEWDQWSANPVPAETTISLNTGANTVTFGNANAAAPNLDCVDVIWSRAVGTRVADGVTVGDDPVIIHFTNTPGVELPSTGGAGTLPYTLSGWLLLLAAALMLYNQKRLGKEGVRN